MTDTALDPKRTALMVIDVQEKLWTVMDEATRSRVGRNILILIEAAKRLGLPILWTEQYVKGLGPTISVISDALSAPGMNVKRLEKLEFSVAAAPDFAQISRDIGRSAWILCGIEAHVCVYQTARDLASEEAVVHVAADAVMSRSSDNRTVGLDMAARSGALITSTELAVFDLLHRAGGDDFKALSRLVK